MPLDTFTYYLLKVGFIPPLRAHLDLQKNRSKNVCEGQGAKLKKSRNVFQNDVGGQQSKYQLHCHR